MSAWPGVHGSAQSYPHQLTFGRADDRRAVVEAKAVTNRSPTMTFATFDQLVDLRRFCEAGASVRILSATFRGGLRLDGIASVGDGSFDVV